MSSHNIGACASATQICLVDNRGVGGSSDPPSLLWSTEDMAKDVLTLLDSLGWGHVHVVRLSAAVGRARTFHARLVSVTMPCLPPAPGGHLYGRYDRPRASAALAGSRKVFDVSAQRLRVVACIKPRRGLIDAGVRYCTCDSQFGGDPRRRPHRERTVGRDCPTTQVCCQPRHAAALCLCP